MRGRTTSAAGRPVAPCCYDYVSAPPVPPISPIPLRLRRFASLRLCENPLFSLSRVMHGVHDLRLCVFARALFLRPRSRPARGTEPPRAVSPSSRLHFPRRPESGNHGIGPSAGPVRNGPPGTSRRDPTIRHPTIRGAARLANTGHEKTKERKWETGRGQPADSVVVRRTNSPAVPSRRVTHPRCVTYD